MLSLTSEMQKTRKTAFRLQAKNEKRRKLAFACKRNAKNGKNSVSLASDEQKTVKTARRLCFFNKLTKKEPFAQVFLFNY